jgi:dTDP-4-amino-4,6-dideoxygalactose transaminase
MNAHTTLGPVPALLGGSPAFPEGIRLVRPPIGEAAAIEERIRGALATGVLTNGPLVEELEARAADYLGVRHCVAVASCTAGLMLVLRAADLTGDVLVPSFTFAATAHAVRWNGLRPSFVDILPDTLTISADAVRRAIGMRTSAILATHIFGTPCEVEPLEEIARQHGIHLFFDAAHAFGSKRGSRMIGGFGEAEVFRLIATDNDLVAERCRMGRDYGHPGDYDCRFVGLNGRMSELHAAVALSSIEDLEARLAERQELAVAYRDALADVPGISFPTVAEGDRSTFKDLTILVERNGFGLGPDELGRALAAEGIETKRYYAPPVHAMQAYVSPASSTPALPVTDDAAARALTLPLWSGMGEGTVARVAAAVRRSRSLASSEGTGPGDMAAIEGGR